MTSLIHLSFAPAASRPRDDVADDRGGHDELVEGDEFAEELVVTLTYPSARLALVRAAGEIDRLTAPRWARALADACAALTLLGEDAPAGSRPGATDGLHAGGRARSPRLVCDLSGVSFLGAAGLAVLVELSDLAARGGVELRLVVNTRAVQRALELTDLEREFRLERRLLGVVDTSGSVR